MAIASRHDLVEQASPDVGALGDEHTCPRCQGFMVDDWLLDMAQGGYLWGAGRRCVNCGHIMQVGVCVNRTRREAVSTPTDRPSWHEAA